MIDPKELRLGNYYYSVVAKDLRQIWCISRGENSMEPIPITDAVLEACGFLEYKFDPHAFFHDTLPNWLTFFLNNDELIASTGCGDSCYDISIADFKYLHQLQNFCFALTGQELPIDEDKLRKTITPWKQTTTSKS